MPAGQAPQHNAQAVHRYVYQGQIIPDPVFPDPFMMLLGGYEGYCENRRAYYFRAIDSGFWHQEAICLGFTFLAKVLSFPVSFGEGIALWEVENLKRPVTA